MDIKKIKTAPYNPRIMGKDAKKALKKSIEEFSDISGIVVNSQTGNVLAGNHRWNQLVDKYGINKLQLFDLQDNEHFLLMDSKGDSTGFIIRVVDWPIEKEKAANITANSNLISGQFTSGLQDVLDDLASSLDNPTFEGLRLDELQIDLDGLDDLTFDEPHADIEKASRESNGELSESDNPEADSVKEVRGIIKVSVPSDLKDEVREDVLEFLATKEYYGLINIV